MLGLAWFVVALGLIVLARSIQRFLPIVVVWSLIGLVGVAWFVYVEVFLIGSICLLCTLAHLMGVLILVSAIVALRSVGWKDR